MRGCVRALTGTRFVASRDVRAGVSEREAQLSPGKQGASSVPLGAVRPPASGGRDWFTLLGDTFLAPVCPGDSVLATSRRPPCVPESRAVPYGW